LRSHLVSSFNDQLTGVLNRTLPGRFNKADTNVRNGLQVDDFKNCRENISVCGLEADRFFRRIDAFSSISIAVCNNVQQRINDLF
jgi:hypothetical protein